MTSQPRILLVAVLALAAGGACSGESSGGPQAAEPAAVDIDGEAQRAADAIDADNADAELERLKAELEAE
jgi:hypothetical protein